MSAARLQFGVWLCVISILCLLCLDRRVCYAEAEFEGFGDDIEDATETILPSGTVDDSAGSAPPADTLYTHSQWDEDEFEVASPVTSSTTESESEIEVEDLPSQTESVRQAHYYYEIAIGIFLVGYAINLWLGRSKNEKLAIAWAKCFTTENSILEKNFALIGPGDISNGEVLMKESQSCFKFYASGRRYCDGLLATLELRQRQDLLSLILYLISPVEDTINIEVYMSEATMPPVVLAVGIPKLIRSMYKEEADLETYCKQISVPKDGLKFWPNERLHVLTEHSAVFYDLFSDARVEQVFADCPKYFRSLHVTSEAVDAKHKKMLKFVFALPPAEKMEDLTKLMHLVPLFIDIIGTYKMSAEIRKKALKTRAEEEDKAFKSGAKARQEALQQKKMEKLLQEKDRIAKMSPEARQKLEEKMQAKAAKKSMKVKMLRS